MRNHEITEVVDLFDENGRIKEPGYAKKPFFFYDRSKMKAPRIRVKEWDYYLLYNDHYGLAFTLSDLGYIRMVSASFLNFDEKTETTRTVIAPPTLGYIMTTQSNQGVLEFNNGGVELRYEFAPNGRHIWCVWKRFHNGAPLRADLWFSDIPEESMNIATPYPDHKHFYLNQKINNMRVSGTCAFDWHVYRFEPNNTLGILDWGRGYWPYHTHWYWGTGNTMIKGKPFGFNLGYGFGDTSAASENMLFWNGKAHKLDDVEFGIPENPMDDWQITSSDGRFEATFTPDLDRAAQLNYGVISSDQHQYFGLMNGTAILDDGTPIRMKDMRCAFEDITNNY